MRKSGSFLPIRTELERRGGLAEQFSKQIKADILSGKLKSGMRLTTAFLSKNYEASVGTLREALAALESESLVELQGGRGFRVAEMSLNELRDLAPLHIEFEVRALVASVLNGDDDWELRVLTSHHQLKKIEALSREERIEHSHHWLVVHSGFHDALVSACPSTWLLRVRSSLFDHMARYRLICQKFRSNYADKGGEHERIRDAALARRAEEAGELMREHIEETLQTALQYAHDYLDASGR